MSPEDLVSVSWHSTSYSICRTLWIPLGGHVTCLPMTSNHQTFLDDKEVILHLHINTLEFCVVFLFFNIKIQRHSGSQKSLGALSHYIVHSAI